MSVVLMLRYRPLSQQAVIDKYHRLYMADRPLNDIINRALNFSEFVNSNYTKCAFDEKEQTTRCRFFEYIIETFQGEGLMCFTLFHLSDANPLNDVPLEAGFSQSAVLLGGK